MATKLALNVVLATLILASLRGEVAEAADLGRLLALGDNMHWDFTDMLYPPTVSSTALAVAFVLSVFKPWGRIPRPKRANPMQTDDHE